jgi:hypothetical protein
VVGSAAHDREHVVDRRVDGRRRFVATPLDLGIAVVVRDAWIIACDHESMSW